MGMWIGLLEDSGRIYIEFCVDKYDIDVITHIMVGLPKETKSDLENTINFLNHHNIQGLKIHSTYIVKNTVLEKMYIEGKYTPISLE